MNPTHHQAAVEALYALPGHLLWRAGARVNAELDDILPDSVDIHSYAALLALAEGEPQSQSTLARLTGTSGTTLAGVARSMLRDGLVERTRSSADRRSYALTRTPAGREVVVAWQPHIEQVQARLTAGLDAADVVRLHELLRRVIGDGLVPEMPRALTDSTGFLVSKAHHRAHRDFAAALVPHDIEPRHFGTLRALVATGPATQGEVADVLDVSAATVVALIDDLEARDLLLRERDPQDRRAYRLHVTGRARTLLEATTPLGSTFLDDRLDGPHGKGRADLVRLLRQLVSTPRQH